MAERIERRRRATSRASTNRVAASSTWVTGLAVSIAAIVLGYVLGCGRGEACPCTTSPPPAASSPQAAHAGAAAVAPTARGGGPSSPSSPMPETPLAAQVAVAVVAAVDRLVDATCSAEQRCGRIGRGRQFADASGCRAGVASRTRARLNATVCETGFVDDSALRACESTIRDAACDDVSDPYETICVPETLCAP